MPICLQLFAPGLLGVLLAKTLSVCSSFSPCHECMQLLLLCSLKLDTKELLKLPGFSMFWPLPVFTKLFFFFSFHLHAGIFVYSGQTSHMNLASFYTFSVPCLLPSFFSGVTWDHTRSQKLFYFTSGRRHPMVMLQNGFKDGQMLIGLLFHFTS